LSAVSTGVDFLRQVSTGQPLKVGHDVLVVGGGNVAVDAARTALRLGADRVGLACLEHRDTMPAHKWEIEAAEAEGITIYEQRTIKGIASREDEITGVECLDVTYVSFDEHGNPTLQTRPGSQHVLPCDSVVLAVGQAPDLKILCASHEVLVNSQGLVSVDPATLMTEMQAVFAGGDVVPGCGTAAEALGLGKRAASSIDAYLNGVEFRAGEKAPVASYEELNIFYHEPSQQNRLPEVPPRERVCDFREVNPGTYDEREARAEAGRCLSCGDCSECDNCWIFCPDMAVLKTGGPDGYRFEYAFCKGCGICAQECPCGVIHMIPETHAGESS
jgi:NADPH-dependent glutamate synthase beta subunit-like oxidoreductase